MHREGRDIHSRKAYKLRAVLRFLHVKPHILGSVQRWCEAE